jgi:PKD repeat protein
MSGDDVGPETLPGNLTGDVRFTLGGGCGTFDYGSGEVEPVGIAPTADAQAKPTRVQPRQKVRFDGSSSFDDVDAPTELAHAWDFDGDGVVDATGSSAIHRYDSAGTYEATLTVTDSGGLTGSDTIEIVVG